MEIGPLVKRNLISVGPDHTLAEAARRMTEHNVGSAVVMTDDHPGIITERDMLRAIAEGADFASVTVDRYMTRGAITASAHWDVHDAAWRMIKGGFRHLVVMNDDGEPIGMLSIRDLVEPLLT